MSVQQKQIIIRRVWDYNLDIEFNFIRACAANFPIAAMDTEFPGVIFRPLPNHRRQTPDELYAFIKANVDALHIIQAGLTLSDADGNLPDFGIAGAAFVWEFNFRDFDISRDLYAVESISLLCNNGIDFQRNRAMGIDSRRFAAMLVSTGLICNVVSPWVSSWVGFHSVYDFGYLIKILTQRRLPEDLKGFLEMVRVIFGNKVYDVKHMIRYCDGLYGGLEKVAEILKVDRSVGRRHQAGSDSLLTLKTFIELKKVVFADKGIEKYAGVLHGFEPDVPANLTTTTTQPAAASNFPMMMMMMVNCCPAPSSFISF